MTPARDAFPDAACSDWLAKIDAWSQRTGRDLGDLAEHEVPCAGCDEVLDMRNLSQVFEHEHRDLPKRPLPVGAPSPSSSVTTTPEKRAELRADLMKRNRGTTHWSGCEGEHRDCMLLALLDEVERLEEALSDKPPPADAALLAKANRMLNERCQALEAEVERLEALVRRHCTHEDGSIDGRCTQCGDDTFPIRDVPYEKWVEAGKP